MIITNVCLLLEALSFVICLHCLYGEKFKLDIATVCFLSINMIVMTAINYLSLPKVYTMIIYPIILVYCTIKFRRKLRISVINLIMSIVIIGGTQAVVMLGFYYISRDKRFENTDLLIVNIIVFLLIVFLLPLFKLRYLPMLLNGNKEKKMAIVAEVCFALSILLLISYKEFETMELYQTILSLTCVVFVFVLAGQVIKFRLKVQAAETELKMHSIYSDSFQSLIENIRMRQHEFDNHINTIFSQHYVCKTYEELVDAQKSYCQYIVNENRFNKLLSCGNSIIVGFLYGKFIEMEKLGIQVTYQVNVNELKLGIPTYKVVEILGDLINNALEEVRENNENKGIYVCIEVNDIFLIEVRNKSSYINHNEINSFFTKGYSKKGENRGYGLYNVKKICNQYQLDILCQNIEIEGSNWLSFIITNKKEGTILP